MERRWSHNYTQMSGMFFDKPGDRLSRRSRFFEGNFVSLLARWFMDVGRRSFRITSRCHEAKFPAATQTADKLFARTFRGSQAADGASIDGLRPHYNWVNIEDQHEISFIRETLAAFARRFPTTGRRSLTLSRLRPEGAGEEIVVANNHGFFHQRQNRGEAATAGSQWLSAGAYRAEA
jgi:hypothetical protein